MDGDPIKLNDSKFTNFKEDQEIIVRINTFLFLPGKLLIGIFFQDNKLI